MFERLFTEWLETLVANAEVNSLTGILELGQDALTRVRLEPSHAELDRQA